MSQYSISQIKQIMVNGVKNPLSEDFKSVISSLSALISNADSDDGYVKQKRHGGGNKNEVFNKRGYRGNCNGSGADNYSREIVGDDADWGTVRNFKTTVIEKKKGVDKKISEIRIALNKFSAKSKNEQTLKIMSLIDDVMADEDEDAEDHDENHEATRDANMEKIVNFVFDIASSNGFYAELYAEFYSNLINKFDAFKYKITDIVLKYKESFNDIVPVDPNKDYDAYCDFVKKNDNRKSMTTFMCYLTKCNVLCPDDLLSIINYMVDLIPSKATDGEMSSVVEELIDNLFIVVTTVYELYKNDDTFNARIMPEIVIISKLRKSDKEAYKGMTSRATFKCMDLIDFVKKKNGGRL
jgi:hypothetical protein